MQIADAVEFGSRNHRGVLCTYRRDGAPQMSPISTGVLDGAFVVSTRAVLAKVRNLERNPAASLLVFTERFFGPWVQVDGQAEIVRQPEALDLLVEVYRTIAGEHPDWKEYREAMVRDERVVLRIRPERASGQL